MPRDREPTARPPGPTPPAEPARPEPETPPDRDARREGTDELLGEKSDYVIIGGEPP
jgi:hypothetical protein